MVPVNLTTSGAQKTYLVTVMYRETHFNFSASVRTQHSWRAKTAINTVVELSVVMESDAEAVKSIVFIRHIYNLVIKHIVMVVICLNVKTRVIRYLRDSHSAT